MVRIFKIIYLIYKNIYSKILNFVLVIFNLKINRNIWIVKFNSNKSDASSVKMSWRLNE